MITVRLKGGLGNQMFQYACGLQHSEIKGGMLQLDETETQKRPQHGGATIANWNIPQQVGRIRSGPVLNFKLSISRRLRNHCRPFPDILVQPDQDHVDLSAEGDALYLEGYWQSEHYFEKISETLRMHFTPNYELPETATEFIRRAGTCESVAIHVRRGDYASDPQATRVHGTLGRDYYQSAISYMRSQLTSPTFFVFSDDHRAASDMLSTENTFMVSDTGDIPNTDLHLVRSCKHQIIANSSFSWWGAWLNRNTKKIVIAPKRWFRDPTRSTVNLLPKPWIKI